MIDLSFNRKEQWCKHIEYGQYSPMCKPDYRFKDEDSVTYLTTSWNLCPICGTPRPKEKTLAQKFREYLPYAGSDMYEGLARIAEDHFKRTKD